MINARVVLGLVFLIVGIAFADDDEPGFDATFGRSDTRMRFVPQGDGSIFDITSETGIDRATVRRRSDKWPPGILVRLHLSGLESFQVENDKVVVEWCVSGTGNNARRVSLHKDGNETLLDVMSPYRTEIRIVGGNGNLPLKDGYFEVPLPAKLFEGNPEEIRLRWIDFYRN